MRRRRNGRNSVRGWPTPQFSDVPDVFDICDEAERIRLESAETHARIRHGRIMGKLSEVTYAYFGIIRGGR